MSVSKTTVFDHTPDSQDLCFTSLSFKKEIFRVLVMIAFALCSLFVP